MSTYDIVFPPEGRLEENLTFFTSFRHHTIQQAYQQKRFDVIQYIVVKYGDKLIKDGETLPAILKDCIVTQNFELATFLVNEGIWPKYPKLPLGIKTAQEKLRFLELWYM